MPTNASKASRNIPTAKEQGVDFSLSQWRGLAVPKGTDAAKVKVLHDAIKATMEDPDFKKLAQKAGMILNYKGGESFANFVKDQDQFYMDLIKSNKMGNKYKY